MKMRMGGLLTVALGAVLIGSGLTSSAAGVVGAAPITCGTAAPGTLTPGCPEGDIVISELTGVHPSIVPSGPGVPNNWSYRITSPCLDPDTGKPVNEPLTVANDGSGSSTSFEIFTTAANTTFCQLSSSARWATAVTPNSIHTA